MSAPGRIATIVMNVGNIKAVLKQSDCTICNLQERWLFSQLEAIAPCKEIQDCVGLHAVNSEFQLLDSSLSQLNLDSVFQSLLDPGFLELYSRKSRVQSPGFLGLHKQKFPLFLKSGFPYMVWEEECPEHHKRQGKFFLTFFF